jgi:Leucyl aminopeptidase (aminopeptidase T)
METKMREYAKLLVEKGANVQKGQKMYISAPVEGADLARMCAEAAYDMGAKKVEVVWSDDFLSRMTYLRADESIFEEIPEWLGVMYDGFLEEGVAKLVLYGSDPELLAGVDPDRIQKYQKAMGQRMEKYTMAQTSNKFQWCVGSYATGAWAKKVFPGIEEDKAVSKLWDEIFKAVRVQGDGGAIERWSEFVLSMKRRIKILNDYAFKYLEYKNELGTDLVVELPRGHYWSGASEKAQNGIEFSANIPSEEIFTLPKSDGVNGTVYASKPLVLSGNVVSNFHMTLRDGKIVSAVAEKGEEILKNYLEIDEGASFLGEVALVPYDSPISNAGVLFYNTLFDENASCHLAFGEAYPMIKGAAELSKEEKKALGINQSFVHEDFMIGTKDLSIVGVTSDGERVQVFKDGNFAF